MKLIVNERDGCCESINIEYTPTEALIINHAMRRYSEDEGVDKKGRTIMEQMLDVKPIFVDVADKEQELKTEQFARWVAREIFDENWEYNKEAFAELACRKLAKLGIVIRMGDEWELIESQIESEG